MSKLLEAGGVDVSKYGPDCTHLIVDRTVYVRTTFAPNLYPHFPPFLAVLRFDFSSNSYHLKKLSLFLIITIIN